MNPELLKGIRDLSVGVICALGLLGALYVIHQQNAALDKLLERQTIALETIARTYSGQ